MKKCIYWNDGEKFAMPHDARDYFNGNVDKKVYNNTGSCECESVSGAPCDNASGSPCD